jgi:hypothetical protein
VQPALEPQNPLLDDLLDQQAFQGLAVEVAGQLQSQ